MRLSLLYFFFLSVCLHFSRVLPVLCWASARWLYGSVSTIYTLSSITSPEYMSVYVSISRSLCLCLYVSLCLSVPFSFVPLSLPDNVYPFQCVRCIGLHAGRQQADAKTFWRVPRDLSFIFRLIPRSQRPSNKIPYIGSNLFCWGNCPSFDPKSRPLT